MRRIGERLLRRRPQTIDIEDTLEETKKILNDQTDFDTVETYKSIRTNIMFSMPKKEMGRVIVVTSASPGEGKTTTSINLAITFAQTGAKVIIVDCDLRKSRVHRYLQIDRNIGVTNVVCGYTELSAAIKHTDKENLDCMTAGEIPPNPAELLETDEFQDMLCTLQTMYDYIVIDTPPMTVVTDAAVIMKQKMGAIVVARQNVTTFDLLDRTMENIRRTGVNLLGVIMVGCQEKGKKYGYYKRDYKYKYKYDYRYGDTPEVKKASK